MSDSRIVLKNFDARSLTEALEFVAKNQTGLVVSLSQIERFLTELVSGPSRVLDVFAENQRIALACLIDTCENPSRTACFELLAYSRDKRFQALKNVVLDCVFETAEKLCAESTQRGLDFAHHQSLFFPMSYLEARGYGLAYKTYKMERLDSVDKRPVAEAEVVQWENLSPKLYAEYYAVLVESFKNNPETSIPSFEVFSKSLPAAEPFTKLLLKESKIIGFVRVRAGDPAFVGEICTLGVLPEYRGRGLGRTLISKGLKVLEKENVSKFVLEVATKNLAALEIYKDFGFKIVDESSVLRWLKK